MSKQTKKSQAAQEKFQDTKICTDVKLWLNTRHAVEGKSYHGTYTYENESHSTFVEDDPKQTNAQQSFPERRYKDLTGTLHGKISKNEHGVTLHMYVRHDDYQNAAELADIFEREVELMCIELSEMNLKEEGAKCGK